MKKILSIFLLLIVTKYHQVAGQSESSIPKFNYDGFGFEGYVFLNFKDSLTLDLHKECIEIYGSVKFSFDETGNMVNIMTSSGVPKSLAEKLKIVLKGANSYWDKENILKIKNTQKEYLLPFYANFTRNSKCILEEKNTSIDFTSATDSKSKLFCSFILMNDFEGRDIYKAFEWFKSMNYPKFEGVVFRAISLAPKSSH